MRRGLIARSPIELPDAVFETRLERVRAAMRERKLDALAVYTNNTRPAAISWLAGFVPYWSEGLLIVPRQGAPYLVVALSFRVKSWIERVSRVGQVLHHPRIGLKAAQEIAATQKDAALGVVDFDGLPAGIAEDLREGGPGLALSDASALFAMLRGKADPADVALAARAGAIAHRALAQACGETLNQMIAATERHARLLGAEEVYIAAAPDLARERRFRRVEGDVPIGCVPALRATVAYKGVWIRLVRTICEPVMARQAAARLAAAVAQLPSGRGFAGFDSWLVEGCRMAQPLEPLMGSRLDAPAPPPSGALVSVQGMIMIDGSPVAVGAPALLGSEGEAAALLADPLCDDSIPAATNVATT
jgi:Creatinase/Prolidase N-terminal domain